MKGRGALMSSASDHWFTPRPVLDRVEQVGPIGLDPCSHPDSPAYERAYRAYTGQHAGVDGLECSWLVGPDELVFVNWPYSHPMPWATRVALQALGGSEIIVLCPARTDTRWWHVVAPPADAIAFWKGRMRFARAGGAPAQGAPFPSALLYFGRRLERFAASFGDAAWMHYRYCGRYCGRL